MIAAKEAVTIAIDNLTDLFSDQKYDNVLLEEIEPDSKRKYKVFKISSNGDLFSIKIREVQVL